jgi:4-amino-4-deoxy-L-arabinose transferase-like glycosyltransferase
LILRIALLNRFPFREDEALYSFWARHTWPADPLFLQVWPDKPPLFIWLLAVVFRFFGASQVSARWLNIMLSVATIPVVAASAQQLWGRRVALITALTFALNPFAISFAATAYTDPLLVLAGLLAYLFALRHRAFWAGFWLAVAIMSKQQGLLYAPLVVGALLMNFRIEIFNFRLPDTRHTITRTCLLWLLGLGVVTLPILYWDSLRWAVAPSPWDLSIRHYGALTLLTPAQWFARLRPWWELSWYLVASWPVWLLVFAASLLACLLGVKTSRKRFFIHLATWSPGHLVLVWILGFLALHMVTSVQTWDRYLLPIAPMLALLVGRLLATWLAPLPMRWYLIGLCAWGLLLTPPALAATNGGLPIGGDHGAYAGLTEAITWVEGEYPTDLILYHHALGWHYRFYLYAPIEAGRYTLRWFPNAVYLADNASKTPGRPKLLIQPTWSPVNDLKLHLAIRQLTLQERQRFGQFTIYEIRALPQPLCSWCSCRLPLSWPALTKAPALMSTIRYTDALH